MCENYTNNVDYQAYFGYISDTYRIHIGHISDTYRTIPICVRYLYYVYPIFIIIYRVPYKSMICYRYFTARYVCEMLMIFTLYVTDFLHSPYTYRVPDMHAFAKYHTHILYISHTYLVPDMYPITSILTSEMISIICHLVICYLFI